MKKILIALLSLTLMVGLLSISILAAVPTQAAQPPIDGDAVLFLDGNTDTIYKGQDDNDRQSFASVASGDKKLIEMTYETDDKNAGLRVDLDGVVNATGKAYLEFWVGGAALETVRLGLRLYALDGSAGDIYAANEVQCFYYLDNGSWVAGTVGAEEWATMALPSHYEGYVRVDVAAYAANIPEYCGNGNALKVSQISGMSIWSNATGVNGSSIYFNDFRFVNADLNAVEPPPAVDPVNNNPGTSDFLFAAVLFGASAVTSAAVVIGKKKK